MKVAPINNSSEMSNPENIPVNMVDVIAYLQMILLQNSADKNEFDKAKLKVARKEIEGLIDSSKGIMSGKAKISFGQFILTLSTTLTQLLPELSKNAALFKSLQDVTAMLAAAADRIKDVDYQAYQALINLNNQRLQEMESKKQNSSQGQQFVKSGLQRLHEQQVRA